jgi:hypothetical protein
MARYVSATVASYSRVKTKKDLKAAAAEGFNAEVTINDFEIGSGIIGINEIPEDWALQVSNAKRSWFAIVTRKGGKVTVK